MTAGGPGRPNVGPTRHTAARHHAVGVIIADLTMADRTVRATTGGAPRRDGGRVHLRGVEVVVVPAARHADDHHRAAPAVHVHRLHGVVLTGAVDGARHHPARLRLHRRHAHHPQAEALLKTGTKRNRAARKYGYRSSYIL